VVVLSPSPPRDASALTLKPMPRQLPAMRSVQYIAARISVLPVVGAMPHQGLPEREGMRALLTRSQCVLGLIPRNASPEQFKQTSLVKSMTTIAARVPSNKVLQIERIRMLLLCFGAFRRFLAPRRQKSVHRTIDSCPCHALFRVTRRRSPARRSTSRSRKLSLTKERMSLSSR
jgi:hypothetical protein